MLLSFVLHLTILELNVLDFDAHNVQLPRIRPACVHTPVAARL
jgi:hypothetical protein